MRSAGAQASQTRCASHKSRFSARFPLILDDMILRDFALYLVMIIATFLIHGAGLHLLRTAHRHRAQQDSRDHAGRVSVEPEPVAHLLDGAVGGAAGRSHHFRADGEIERTDGDEGHRHQHLSRGAAGDRALRHFRGGDCSSSISFTFRTPTKSRKSCATRSRASLPRPICRRTASGFSGRTTKSTTTRSSIPTPTSSAGSRSSSSIPTPSNSPGASTPSAPTGKRA